MMNILWVMLWCAPGANCGGDYAIQPAFSNMAVDYSSTAAINAVTPLVKDSVDGQQGFTLIGFDPIAMKFIAEKKLTIYANGEVKVRSE